MTSRQSYEGHKFFPLITYVLDYDELMTFQSYCISLIIFIFYRSKVYCHTYRDCVKWEALYLCDEDDHPDIVELTEI